MIRLATLVQNLFGPSLNTAISEEILSEALKWADQTEDHYHALADDAIDAYEHWNPGQPELSEEEAERAVLFVLSELVNHLDIDHSTENQVLGLLDQLSDETTDADIRSAIVPILMGYLGEAPSRPRLRNLWQKSHEMIMKRFNPEQFRYSTKMAKTLRRIASRIAG